MPILIQILLLHAATQGEAKYTRVKVNTGGIKKVHETAYQEYTCTTCGKHFSEKKYRDEHMAIHLDELKNKCPKCSKKYRWHSSLSKHMIVKHPPTPHPTPERSPSPEF